MGGVPLRAPWGQMQGAATQAILNISSRSCNVADAPTLPVTRRAQGGCGAFAALFVVDDVFNIAFLLTPCACPARPLRGTPPITRTHS